ncbi:nuclear transport factor 2 family protein [Mycobacterium sp. 663a-19]|uniref:nuclear transport factor 2 family protein n=1 Tax=Mycobacterium sp. 663a-19 TaxID=2986148 RepID=UPI002D1F6D8A|nr:nuclear transport factor 2 family protein [Mycobacterium sp. 663a-19]MEB3981701.1 nuclear transport factor 2 family protein [Mycobacterium sp. 663a-19]
MISATDRAALSDLVHRYAAGVDDREFDAVAALFATDGQLIVPDPPGELRPTHPHRGREAIAAAVGAVAAVPRTEHAIVGEVYDVYDDMYDDMYDDAGRHGAARGRIACVAHHWDQRAGEVVDVVWHLRYDDDYKLTDAGWRIARRALTINAIETRPVRRLLPRDSA